ncbi:MAG: hypothetical protein U9Q81_03745 [Pseudomonadota bacterium]|nr:hypothetical protein [Pseudomonadota bacterium]
MSLRKTLRQAAVSVGLIAAALTVDGWIPSGWMIEEAEARFGRPLTPISVAGVARRTTRRHIYATAVYAASLPRGCTTVVVEGTALHQCGGTYYQASGSRYVVVKVD